MFILRKLSRLNRTGGRQFSSGSITMGEVIRARATGSGDSIQPKRICRALTFSPLPLIQESRCPVRSLFERAVAKRGPQGQHKS